MKLTHRSLSFASIVALCVACSSTQASDDSPGSAASGNTGGTSKGGQNAGGSVNSGAGTSAVNGGMSGGGMSGGGMSSGGMSSGGMSSGGMSGGGNSSAGTTNFGGGGAGGAGKGGMGGGGGKGGTGGGGAGAGGKGGTGGGGMSGNAGSTSCSFPGSWNPGSPTYTTYTLPNAQTACGYNGNNNTIKNIATPANFAAIPGNSSSDFNTDNRCGACVQIGNAIVTIVDECPFQGNTPCQNNPGGHLDLSMAAANAGNVQGNPDLHNQNAWKFVPCPINGNVIVRLKNGNDNEIYIENEILPIASVTCGNQTGSRQSYGAWHFNNSVKGGGCSVTDIAGRSINITVGMTQNEDVNSGTQFPKCN